MSRTMQMYFFLHCFWKLRWILPHLPEGLFRKALSFVTGPFHGTVELKLSVILGKLAYNAHWPSYVNWIQTAFDLVEENSPCLWFWSLCT